MTDQPPPPADDDRRGAVAPIAIEEELQRSYLSYAMSVIVSRALPDARDGLKPVHRRILYSMNEQGHTSDRPYVKSARVVGDVMGKYHPHGDLAIYDSLVRMAQPFSMGLTLIDGQGNFGSVDNDPPAQMRYTECRLTKAAEAMMADIDAGTVDFRANYDEKEREPTVLPARIPNLLVNGSGGIAVGMATNIPPHNLGEVVDACLAMIDDPAISAEALLEHVPGPDFPTGGEIIGRGGARAALLTGRGPVIVRGAVEIETSRGGRDVIVISSLPYQVNKAALCERIGELAREKRIEGIAELRDESDRQGLRVVIELKRDAAADVVLNQLYRFTALQSSFPVNALALDRGRPILMTLRDMVSVFVAFREEVVERRTKFELAKARDRGHVLVGLAIAVVNIDEVIHIIRSSKDPAEARERLVGRDWPVGDMLPLVELIADPRTALIDGEHVRLTEEQARAILALTLSRLTGLGREEIFAEAQELADEIEAKLDLLSSREKIMGVVRAELEEVKARFAVPRRTAIVDGDADLEDEDLIVREEMVITVTHGGYVKRTPLTTFRLQNRGGKGKSGMATKEEDAVTRVFSASTHTPMLFFSSGGKVYKLKVWRLPIGTATARGKAFVNLFPIEHGETMTSILALPEDEAAWEGMDVMFATRSGGVRRNRLSDFVQVNKNGKIAMKLDEGDAIIGVALCQAADDVLLTSALGRCIRFPVDDVRVFAGRASDGVRGIRLARDDSVISMAILRAVDATGEERAAYLKHASAMRRAAEGDDEAPPEPAAADEPDEASGDEVALSVERIAELAAAEQFILTVTSEGYGKRTSSYEYRRTGRGGQGLIAFDLSRGGRLVASFPVEDADEILLVTDQGQVIRVQPGRLDSQSGRPSVGIKGRNTQGVIIFRTGGNEHVVSVERIEGGAGADDGADEDEGEAGAAEDDAGGDA
ncbi:MAG TPA: DNA gyrase subunit A [Caulobacteraceae bacterium]